MKKNYFMKNLLTAVMLLAVSMSMTSCDDIVAETDNPAPTSKPETKPETKPEEESEEDLSNLENITITDEGAKVEASSTDEVSAALQVLVKDIVDKGVGEDKEYVLEVTSDVFNTGDIENIKVPEIEGATINIVITTPFTAPTTLVFSNNTPATTRQVAKTRGDDEDSKSVDKMYITLPDVAGDAIPTFEFSRPNTEIVLRSANGNSLINIKDVNEGSCAGTFRLGKGVSVDTYKYTQRKENEYVWMYTENIYYYDEDNNIEKTIALDHEQGDRWGEGIAIHTLEVLPSDHVVRLRIGGDGVGTLLLADGVKVQNLMWDSELQKVVKAGGMPNAELIESKGTSTLLMLDANEEDEWRNWLNHDAKGIVFAKENGESVNFLTFRFANGSTDCTFNSEKFCFGSQWNAYENGVTISENQFISNGETHSMEINVPAESDEDKLFELTFNKCGFSAGTKFKVNFKSEGYTDFIARIYLTDCTYGDAAITNETAFVAASPVIPEGAKLYYNIGGTDYKVDNDGTLTLVD